MPKNRKNTKSTTFTKQSVPKEKSKKNDTPAVVEEVKVEKLNKNSEAKKEKKVHRNVFDEYIKRVSILCVIVALLIGVGLFLIIKSFGMVDGKVIKYNDKSDIDYKVYLKPNDFYESPFLQKDMTYVASLIDYIKLDYNYYFVSDHDLDVDFSYKIMGKLVISDASGKSYFEKDYTLLDSRKISMLNNSGQTISQSIDIDYDYYNAIANSFKATYGVDTTSTLVVYMAVNKSNSQYESEFNLSSTSNLSVNIPLSQKAVNIKLNYNAVNEQNNVIAESDMVVQSVPKVVVGLLLILISLYYVVQFVRLVDKSLTRKSAYDKFIEKILREYDRLIVETTSMPTLENKQVVKIGKFTELLDVRDNLKLPVMYYVVAKHQKANFYILDNNLLYLYIAKAVDIEATSHGKN